MVILNTLMNNKTPVKSFYYRMFTFTGGSNDMTSRKYIGGNSTTGYTTNFSYSYTPPANTMLSDSCLWVGLDGCTYGAHSGYITSPFTSNLLPIFKSSIPETQNYSGTVVFNVVTSIDMSLSGRIYETIGGYTGIGPSPIISSPEYVARPGGKVGLFFMYQPNGLNTSNSYIMYIESTDNTCKNWGNAKLITGNAMSYDSGNYNSNIAGSYIDPAYFNYNGKHMLILRAFSFGNGQSTCLGLRIVSSSTSILGPYNTIESNLFTTASGGINTYIKNTMEGQSIELLSNGSIRLFVDDYANGGIQYATSTNGLNPSNFGSFTLVTSPTPTFTLRHASPVQIIN